MKRRFEPVDEFVSFAGFEMEIVEGAENAFEALPEEFFEFARIGYVGVFQIETSFSDD